MRRDLIPVLVLLLLSVPTYGQLTAKDIAKSRRAATNSIERFRAFLTPQNCQLHGFNSTNDAAISYPGDPFPFAKFDSRALERYREAKSTKGLIRTEQELLYPILVNGTPVSSTRLKLKNQHWEVIEWGRPNAIRELSTSKSNLLASARAAGRSPDHIFALQTPLGGWWMAGFADRRGELTLQTSAPIPPSTGTNHTVSRKELEELGKLTAARKSGSD